MHSLDHLGPRKIIGFLDGQLFITETVCFAWIVSIVLIIFALLATRKMQRVPKGFQFVGELIVETIYKMVGNTMGQRNIKFAPYIGTLFMFLLLGSAFGLFGFRPVTSDINAAAALGVITFCLIQVNSIRSKGPLGYVKHFGDPLPFIFPIKVIEEIAFPISLSCRLFGNILGGAILMALLMQGLGGITKDLTISLPFFQILIPLPVNLFFDVFEPVLQSFIFSMLTMVFVANAITIHDAHENH